MQAMNTSKQRAAGMHVQPSAVLVSPRQSQGQYPRLYLPACSCNVPPELDI